MSLLILSLVAIILSGIYFKIDKQESKLSFGLFSIGIVGLIVVMLIYRGVSLSIDEIIPLIVLISAVITLSGIYFRISKPESKLHLILFSIGIAGLIVSIWASGASYQSIQSVFEIFSF